MKIVLQSSTKIFSVLLTKIYSVTQHIHHTYTQLAAENTAFSNIESIKILVTIINL